MLRLAELGRLNVIAGTGKACYTFRKSSRRSPRHQAAQAQAGFIPCGILLAPAYDARDPYLCRQSCDQPATSLVCAHSKFRTSDSDAISLPRRGPLSSSWVRSHARAYACASDSAFGANDRAMCPMHEGRIFTCDAKAIRGRDLAAWLSLASSSGRRGFSESAWIQWAQPREASPSGLSLCSDRVFGQDGCNAELACWLSADPIAQ